MLISYPILPIPSTQEGENELEAFIRYYVDKSAGRYPISYQDRWHGGVHLHPGEAPIRAIADGEVVAYRITNAPDTYINELFDSSFVLLKHGTETGGNTRVEFYSLYMHLANRRDLLRGERVKQLPDWLQQATPSPDVKPGNGRRVWRKDILGFCGQLYGDHHVHFEVFAPDIDGFWKESDQLPQGANGSEDFFGDAGFVIPSGTHFLDTHPQAGAHAGSGADAELYVGVQEQPAGEEGWSGGESAFIQPVPVDDFLGGLGTAHVNTDGRLFVSLRYDKGSRIATSYQINAKGDVEQIGKPVVQQEYEYNLYSIASTLYPDCPSAGYEWLRFGRELGPDRTVHRQNWQLVRYGKAPDAVGYVDLAAENVTKLSDADFPFWQGWQRINKDGDVFPEDSIGNVSVLQALLNLPVDGPSLLTPHDFAQRYRDPSLIRRLRHLVCQFGSEWDDRDLDMRYEHWCRHARETVDASSREAFKEHVQKMAFWSQAELPRSVWYFHSLQFIAHHQKCGWRSPDELAQLMPRNPGEGNGPISWAEAISPSERFGKLYPNLGKTFRKYGITSPERQSFFLSQIYTETLLLTLMTEIGQGRSMPYGAFYGRGLMQITWPVNYALYGSYRSFPDNGPGRYGDERISASSLHPWSGQNGSDKRLWSPRYDPSVVGTDDYNICDSGGFFWVSKHFLGHMDISRLVDEGVSADTVGRVNVLVNGGYNGYEERLRYAFYAYRFLSDSTDTELSKALKYQRQSLMTKNGKLQWVSGSSGTVKIDFTPQRP